MKVWKSALVSFNKVNAKLEEIVYNDSVCDYKAKKAKVGYLAFAKQVGEITNGLIRIQTEIIDGDEIIQLSLNHSTEEKAAVWIDSFNLIDSLNNNRISITTGQYDSIFAILPYEAEGLNTRYHLWGWGQYAPKTLFGATYGCLPLGPGWDLDNFDGEAYLHEWLHGVCQFFKDSGFTIPEEESDGAEKYGYKRTPEGSWINYYRDLMNNRILTKEGNIGIPKEAWLSKTPSE